MQIFKTKLFSKWAKEEGLNDEALDNTINELINDLYEANLGGSVYKKRVSVSGRGKSGGTRTLIAYRENDRAIFLYGFAKNERDNINNKELSALKKLAKIYLNFDETETASAVKSRELIEVLL